MIEFLAVIGMLSLMFGFSWFITYPFRIGNEPDQEFYLHQQYKDCPMCKAKPQHQIIKQKMTMKEATQKYLHGRNS